MAIRAHMFRTPKDLAKKILPGPVVTVTRWMKSCLIGVCIRVRRIITGEQARRRQTFQTIYKNNLWGTEENCEFFSGDGSRGQAAKIYVERMSKLLKRHISEQGRAITIVDIGCGDFQIGRALMATIPDSFYVGCDIVPELIMYNTKLYATAKVSFRVLDIVAQPLPQGDVYLVRQVLQHLSNANITGFLERVNCKYLYVTEGHPIERVGPANPDTITGVDVRFDQHTGRGRGVDLDQPPYSLTTKEMFRAFAPPKEVIITELVVRTGHTGIEKPTAYRVLRNIFGTIRSQRLRNETDVDRVRNRCAFVAFGEVSALD